MKRLCATFLCLILLLSAAALPAAAAGQPSSGAPAAGDRFDAGHEAAAAVAYLTAALPAPGPQDAAAVLAVLRSGQPVEAGWAQGFVAAMQAPGTAFEDATAWENAMQMLALAAAGAEVPEALAEALAGKAATNAEAKAAALLAFTATGHAVPRALPGLKKQAQALAGEAWEGGGFGDKDSDLLPTARVVQALAPHTDDAAVQAAVEAALAWLREHAAAYGGFNVGGAPSALAAAEAEIAQGCLGGEALGPGAPAPAELVRAFQNDDGGFSPNPDAPSDPQLTAVCLLALAAQARRQAGLPGVYSFGAGGAEQEAESPLDGLLGGFTLPAIGEVSAPVMAAILAGVVLLVVAVAIPVARRQRRRQKKLLRMEAARPEGGGKSAPAENARQAKRAEHAKKAKPAEHTKPAKPAAKAPVEHKPAAPRQSVHKKKKKPYHKL